MLKDAYATPKYMLVRLCAKQIFLLGTPLSHNMPIGNNSFPFYLQPPCIPIELHSGLLYAGSDLTHNRKMFACLHVVLEFVIVRMRIRSRKWFRWWKMSQAMLTASFVLEKKKKKPLTN